MQGQRPAGGTTKVHDTRRLCLILAAMLLVSCVSLAAPHTAVAAVRTVLYTPNLAQYPNADASYPRVIRLAASGTLLATFSRSGHGGPSDFPIYRSLDGGATWSATPISVVADTLHGWSLDAPTLFELPQAVGTLPAGTILAAGTAWIHGPIVNGSLTGADYRQQDMQVYVSLNQGQSWSYHSSCLTSSNMPNQPGYGIWEPSFALDSQGRLVCYFSDERFRDSGYNQVIAHVVWDPGTQTWGSEVFDVAIQDNEKRPGMPIVVRLPNGRYLMSYEMCRSGFDPDQACSVYVKTSPDGVTWSPASDPGTLVQTSDGRRFLHTPYVAWSPAGGPNGTLLLAGQRLVRGPDGNVTTAAQNGRTLLINTNLGAGYWDEIPTPFPVDPVGLYRSDDTLSGCAAYSPAVLPSTDGTRYLYIVGTQIANGNCEVRVGSAVSGVLPFSSDWNSGTDASWTTYGGSWSVVNGVYRNSAIGAGHKAVAGSTGWADYTLEGDVRLTSPGQAGFILRVTDPSIGADAFNGYYVGIESSTGVLIVGRMNNSYTALSSRAVAGGIAVNGWYHVVAQVIGCTLNVSLTPAGASNPLTSLSYIDEGCLFRFGQVGVRSHFTTAEWRNVTVASFGTSAPPADGAYRLRPKHAAGSALDVNGCGGAGTAVQLWQWLNNDCQRWILEAQGNGWYELKSLNNPTLNLQVSGAGTANGTSVTVGSDTSGSNQWWKLEPAGDGYYRLTPQHAPGKYLDLAACGTTNGTAAQIWTATDCEGQLFRLDPVASVANGVYRLTPKHALGSALDVNACGGAGTFVQLWQWLNNNCQRWVLEYQGDGWYELKSNNNLALNLEASDGGTANGTVIVVANDQSSPPQRWRFEWSGANWYRLAPQHAPGKYLDPAACGTSNGTRAQLWDKTNCDGQRYRFEP